MSELLEELEVYCKYGVKANFYTENGSFGLIGDQFSILPNACEFIAMVKDIFTTLHYVVLKWYVRKTRTKRDEG
jgi:hypothetical protein